MGSRREAGRLMTWAEICTSREYRGRWVALDGVRYDEVTARPTEGTVVDSDDDLAELCGRVRSSDRCGCAILYCEEHEIVPVASAPKRPRLSSN
jgi:hypothetical protein